ncbi:tRNA (adenosine(37)-N6)-dimethylallyltransferase MiaA [Desulfovulcanus sp.]
MKPSQSIKPKIICILGPTGTGKTDLALTLAKKVDISVINFDSRQVYKELPVVTAQPSAQEQSVCPHYLYGFLTIREKISAGEFVSLASDLIWREWKRQRLPVLVGGTGLYLRSLLYGLAPIPPVPDSVREEVKLKCEKYGPENLYRELKKIDKEYAEKIHPRDRQRITRALEVYLGTGTTVSDWHKRHKPELKFSALKIGLSYDLDELTKRLAIRIDKMLSLGAVEEVQKAYSMYKDETLPGFSGIGCPEIIAYLKGDITFEEARKMWLKNTRAYAKRQITWFKKEDDIFWFKQEEVKLVWDKVKNWLECEG